jgi:hypothetical protein
MPTGCYIANRKSITKDDYGHDIETFQTPEYFNFLLMPSGTNSVDAQRYGEQVDTMYTAYIPKSFIGKFHRGDRAYLIDEDLQDLSIALQDNEDCENANYKLIACQPQNIVIKLLFQKIKIDEN